MDPSREEDIDELPCSRRTTIHSKNAPERLFNYPWNNSRFPLGFVDEENAFDHFREEDTSLEADP
jgi:hypothetical protein